MAEEQVSGPMIYQLKVTLDGSAPPIWRRIQVPGSITLARLHRLLQVVMGWEDDHLHQFTAAGVHYGVADPGDFGEVRDERRVRLDEVAPGEGFRFTYTYDFGDGWEHTVLLEKVLPPEPGQRYPVCLAGRRAGPPEDVGGIWGYAHFLEAIQDPRHEEHDEYLEWIGGAFDPEALDLAAINARLAPLPAAQAGIPDGEEPLLWTLDKVARFTRHPENLVRRWAIDRLKSRFPEQAGALLAGMLDDPYPLNVLEACAFLGETGDGERYGPALLAGLAQADDERFGYRAEALGRLGYQPALPAILERLVRALEGQSPLHPYAHWRMVEAVGLLGGEAAREVLWKYFAALPPTHTLHGRLTGALLETGRPEDVARVVEVYRSWPFADRYDPHLDTLAAPAEATHLAQEVGAVIEHSLGQALETAWGWLGRKPRLSDPTLQELQRSARRRYEGAMDVLRDEARRVVQERGDDVAAWSAEWAAGVRLAGYRRRAAYSLALLEALAARPSRNGTQRRHEAGLGLALLCQLSVEHDWERWLAQAEDRDKALLDMLLDDREHVLPGAVEQAAALGPGILPQLLGCLDPAEFDWGSVRAVATVERLARLYPGSCDTAVPVLIDMLHEEQSDYLMEACLKALVAIGPAAVRPIGEHLRDGDGSRYIFLTGVLEAIPTAGAAQAILSLLEEGYEFDEMQYLALAGIGSAAAIEPLYGLWQEDQEDPSLAEALLVLCALHGVKKPENRTWHEVVAEQDRLLEEISLEHRGALAEEGPPDEEEETEAPLPWPLLPLPGPAAGVKSRAQRKPKGVGKKEQKKRAAQRKAQRKGKKKRKR